MKANRLRLFYFWSFVSFGAYLPFFPTWLEARGVRGVAMSALMALGPALGVLGPPGFGALSDWLGLRAGLLRVVTGGGLAATLLLAVPGALGHAPALPILFVAMLLFSMSRAPAVAMADVITIEATKALPLAHAAGGKGGALPTLTYGGIRLWGSIGFLVSAALVGRVLDVRAPAALPLFLLAAALVTFALSFTLDAAAPSRARHIGAPLARLLRQRPFAMLLVSAFVGFGAHASYDICFSLHLQRLGAGAEQVGAAWALGTLAEVGLMAVSGRLIAAVPASWLLVVAFAGGALRWVLIATVRDVPVLIALQPLHAASFALVWVTSIDHVKQLAPREILATAQGVFNSAVGGGAVLGMFAWGATFEAYGGPVTFACAAGAAGCAALAAAWTGPRPRASGMELL